MPTATDNTVATGLHVLSLEAENFMRLKSVRIQPTGKVVEIKGNNAQGKTSILNAIAFAMDAAATGIETPLRKGTEKGRVVLDLGDYKVERRMTKKSMTLTVTDDAGNEVAKPQTALAAIFGALTFDPLAFTRLKPAEQMSTLARLAGIDLAAMEAKRRAHYDERTTLNRLVKTAETQLAAVPAVDAPDEEVSASGLMARIRDAQQTCNAIDQKRGEVQRLEREAAGIEEHIEQMRMKIKEMEATSQALCDRIITLNDELEGMGRPDVESLTNQMGEIEQTNAKVRQKRQRETLAGELKALTEKAETESRAIQAVDDRKAEALAKASLPVDGLALGDGEILFNGVPFAQASMSEQIRVSTAMAMALNPKVRVALVRDASLLDDRSFGLLCDMAVSEGFQVWVERLSDGSKGGIVIEDGEVVE